MLRNVNPTSCPSCHQPTLPTYYFCPNCGKSLQFAPALLGVGKQIGLYALSIFLPPLGIFPGIKYMLTESPKAKIVGLVMIILTLLSTIITLWWTMGILHQVTTSLQSVQNLNY